MIKVFSSYFFKRFFIVPNIYKSHIRYFHNKIRSKNQMTGRVTEAELQRKEAELE